MPAIAPEPLRRAFLLALVALPLGAAEAPDVLGLFNDLATALSAGEAGDFMRPFDSAMPGRDRLRGYINAICRQTDVTSSVEIVEDEGGARSRRVVVDWLMQLQSRETGGPLERRHQQLRFGLELRGKKWKIVSLDPIDFFAPLRPR